jgi:hypothetical protein
LETFGRVWIGETSLPHWFIGTLEMTLPAVWREVLKLYSGKAIIEGAECITDDWAEHH